MTIQRQLHWGAACLLLALAALASAQSPATLPADLDPDSRARLPYLRRKDIDEKNLKILDGRPGRSLEGVLRGPLAFAAYNPVSRRPCSISTTPPWQGRSTRTCGNSPYGRLP